MNDDYLAHYGIPGQKWGVRRYQNKDGTLTEAGKARKRGESSSTPNKPRSASEMTDQELRDAINRKRLENDYNNLYGLTSNKKMINLGTKFVNAVSNKAVESLAGAVVATGATFIAAKTGLRFGGKK